MQTQSAVSSKSIGNMPAYYCKIVCKSTHVQNNTGQIQPKDRLCIAAYRDLDWKQAGMLDLNIHGTIRDDTTALTRGRQHSGALVTRLVGYKSAVFGGNVNSKVLLSLLFAVSFVVLPAAAAEGVTLQHHNTCSHICELWLSWPGKKLITPAVVST